MSLHLVAILMLPSILCLANKDTDAEVGLQEEENVLLALLQTFTGQQFAFHANPDDTPILTELLIAFCVRRIHSQTKHNKLHAKLAQ